MQIQSPIFDGLDGKTFDMNAYKIINEKNWARAVHCALFRNYVEPNFCVTFNVDVSNFRKKIRAENLSFTLSMVYAVCKCANELENFRYRFLDGAVVLFDKIDTAFTLLDEQTELFKVVNVPFVDNLQDYVALAKEIADSQTEYFTAPLGNDVFQCSPMPWLTFTHISHTVSGKKDVSTPLFDWGKFREVDGKFLIPLSVQAHHSFVDGVHVAKFADRLQTFLNEL